MGSELEWEVPGYDWFSKSRDELLSVYRQQGILLLKGFLRESSELNRYLADLRQLTSMLLSSVGDDSSGDLSSDLARLAQIDRSKVGLLYDLGTRPGKIDSEAMLRSSPKLRALAQEVLGSDALLANPLGGDTLHIYPPDVFTRRFYLPWHQDFPYLLQSENQVTFWIPLEGQENDSMAGIRVALGSHKLGLLQQTRNSEGLFFIPNEVVEQFEVREIKGVLGDVVVIHPLVIHASVVNDSRGKARITQLFRYSDLSHPSALRMGFRSAQGVAEALRYEDCYPNGREDVIPAADK